MKLNFVGKLRPGRQRRSCPASATPSSGSQSRWPGRRCLRWLAGRSSAAWMLSDIFSIYRDNGVLLVSHFWFTTASFNQCQQIMITCQASPNLGCESVPILPRRGECLPQDPPERKKGWTGLVSQTWIEYLLVHLWYGWQLCKSHDLTLHKGRFKLNQADVVGKIHLA